MPNRTEWMIAHSVVVEGTALPNMIRDKDGTGNTVAAIRIQRTSGVGALIIEGQPGDLLKLAHNILAVAENIEIETNESPALRSLYGRV